jgi:predicted metal-dependent peptidase
MQNENTVNQVQIMEEIAKVTTKLMVGDSNEGIDNEPFYGHFFSGIVKRITNEADTLAVGYHNNLVSLYINPHFWQEHLTSIQYKVGGIKHEILHIVFKHIFRHKGFNQKTIFNVAADLVVNQYIKPAHLIEGAILLDNFPELKLERNQHLNYYYNILMELYQKFVNDDNSDEAQNNQSWQILKRLIDQDNANQRRHAFWKRIEDLTNAEREILESAINQGLESTLSRLKPDQYGKLPAGLQQYLQEFQQSMLPIVNWRRILRLFTNSSSRTRIKNTLRRPSKRYGTNPGIKVKKKQKILVAIDTSGSISREELQEFFNEIYHIWRQGAQIFVVECDAAIANQYFYTGKTPQTVSGGGGTAFEPPIHYANDIYRPDALIYFTDAYGANPDVKPICPILWLISKNGANVDGIREFPGRKVKMI